MSVFIIDANNSAIGVAGHSLSLNLFNFVFISWDEGNTSYVLVNSGASVFSYSDSGTHSAIIDNNFGMDTIVIDGHVGFVSSTEGEGTAIFSNGSQITIGATGSVESNETAITGGSVSVTNHGTITGYVAIAGCDTITNAATINGSSVGIHLNLNYGSVINSGHITGGTGIIGSDCHIVNNGTIAGTGDNAIILESSTLAGTIQAVAIIANYGTINGRFGGIVSQLAADEVAVILNKGNIFGGIAIEGSAAAEVVTNEGAIHGAVSLGAGDDLFENLAGTVTDLLGNASVVIDLGAGVDTLRGGASAERVNAGDGNDIDITLGGGDDTFFANANTAGTDGNDIADGGSGSDTYSAALSKAGVTIDLDNDIAFGTRAGNDSITSFESAVGSGFADTLYGTAGANVLSGGLGADTILGADGNDNLKGDGGIDKITGGLGRDSLRGGTDADTFIYKAVSESTVAGAGRDYIMDFSHLTDKIDLAAIDAKSTVAADQAFTLIGSAAFSGVAGQLRFAYASGYTLISGDTNGDKAADFTISLFGSLAITTADFVL